MLKNALHTVSPQPPSPLGSSRFRYYNKELKTDPQRVNTKALPFVAKDVLQFNGNMFLTYNARPTRAQAATEAARSFNLINLTAGLSNTNGFISGATYRRLKKIVGNWFYSMTAHRLDFKQNGLPFKFVTLTLPSPQLIEDGESDQEIKRKCLNTMCQKLRRRNIWYIWKAEPQKNGNIHFHLIIDHFYDKEELRRDWNKCLEATTQIDRFEAKHGHRNPPTTQIDQARSQKAAGAYLVAYFKDLTKHQGRRKIEGKLWGMHNRLKHLAPFSIHANGNPALYDYFSKIAEQMPAQRQVNEDFFSFKIIEPSKLPDPAKVHLRNFYAAQYRILKAPSVNWWKYAQLHSQGSPKGYNFKRIQYEKSDQISANPLDLAEYMALEGLKRIGNYYPKIPNFSPESPLNDVPKRPTIPAHGIKRSAKSSQTANSAQLAIC